MRNTISLVILSACLALGHSKAYGANLNFNDLCHAIRKAEGNPNYGILNGSCDPNYSGHCHFMCKEILGIYKQRWDGRGDWLKYVQSRWAPLNVANDPNNLNSNWLRNVRYHLNKRR